MTIRAHAFVAAGLLALAGCASGGHAAPAPATPSGSFCQVVLKWSNAEVGTINHFSLISPNAKDVQERRRLYLAAWTGLDGLTAWLDAATGRAPAPTRTGLHQAVERVRAELKLGHDQASALPDTSYRDYAVDNGTLFTSTEKTRDVVYQTLDDLRTNLGASTVPVACGRDTEPVTLPVITPP